MTTFCTGQTRCSAFDPINPSSAHKPQGTALLPSTSTGRTPTAKSSFRLVIRLLSSPPRSSERVATHLVLVLFPITLSVGADRPTEPRLCAETSSITIFLLLAPIAAISRTSPNKPLKVFVHWVHIYILCFVQRLHVFYIYTSIRRLPPLPFVFTLVLIRAISEPARERFHIHICITTYILTLSLRENYIHRQHSSAVID